MSYVDALFRASQKANSRARKVERDAKRKLFDIVETLDSDFDEIEIFEIDEARDYLIAN